MKRFEAISLPMAPNPMKAIAFEREAVSCEVDVVDMRGAHCAVTIDDDACAALLVRRRADAAGAPPLPVLISALIRTDDRHSIVERLKLVEQKKKE